MVSLELARSRHRKLNEGGGDWGQDDRQEPSDDSPASVTVALVPSTKTSEHEPPLGKVRDQRDGAGQHRHHRADQDVPISHVRELVRQNAIELPFVKDAEKTFIDADGG